MFKKSIIVYALIVGSGSIYAAAGDCDDREGSHTIAPHLGTYERKKWPSASREPFSVYGDGSFNSLAHQQLLFIGDESLSGWYERVVQLKKGFKRLGKEHADGDVVAMLKSVAYEDDALLVFFNGTRMAISYKGVATRALLIKRDGAPERLMGDACVNMGVCNGVVFMRGMMRTDEQINETVQTVLAQKKKTPCDVAEALVNAENGECVAAAFLDYDILKANKAAVRKKP